MSNPDGIKIFIHLEVTRLEVAVYEWVSMNKEHLGQWDIGVCSVDGSYLCVVIQYQLAIESTPSDFIIK